MGTTSQQEADAILREYRVNFVRYSCVALKILTKSGETVPLELNRAQVFVHAKLEAQRKATGRIRALILKGRQQGISTYVQGRYYWRTSGEFGKRAVILTHEDKATEKIFNIGKRFHENCPDELRPATGASNAKQLAFSKLDSAYEVGTAGSTDTGRGGTGQFFHGSEVAFWKNPEKHLAGIGQVIPDLPETEIIHESTANGPGNVFHSMWQDAEAGRGEYIPIFVPWYWQPEYSKPVPSGFVMDADEAIYAETYSLDAGQMAWRRAKITDDFRGDASLFDQEYPATALLAFRHSAGQTLIKHEWVERAARTQNVEAIGARILGVDPAEYGDDETAFCDRQGRVVHKIWGVHGRGPMEVVGIIATLLDTGLYDYCNIDATNSRGITDRLDELGYSCTPVVFGERAVDEIRYMRKVDEIWGDMADWFQAAPNIIPNDEMLKSDCVARLYKYDSARRKIVEPKEKMKERLKRSPDRGDALATTFAVPIGPAKGIRTALKNRQRATWRTA